jgi:hypothetical protein
MSVIDPNVVDIIGLGNSDMSVSLGISDPLPWNEELEYEHFLALQEKVNRYMTFIETGEIYSSCPAASGRRIRIEIRCKFAPSSKALVFLQKLSEVFGQANVELRWKTLGGA